MKTYSSLAVVLFCLCLLWTQVCSFSIPRQATKTSALRSALTEESNVISPTYLAVHNETVTFPPYHDLMQLRPGEYVTSKMLTVSGSDGHSHDFCVKLYPRGGGHASTHSVLRSNQKSGFGMSYKVLPMFGNKQDEKVGVYLQFLPKTESDSVDASFGLRLKGKQSEGRRFDVEWRAGMRFVSLDRSKLKEGQANDFGAHLMQTPLLESFAGADEITVNGDRETINGEPMELHVEIYIHAKPAKKERNSDKEDGGFGLLRLHDIREGPAGHDAELARAGRIVVPILRRLSQRQRMFQQGVYPGVEYRILRVIDPDTKKDVFYSQPSANYELKPIYPLVDQLERPWPVRVNERDIPKLYTRNMYNAVSAIGSLITAFSGLLTAFLASQAVSLFFIPSRSMEPTLQVGDVLLVDKVTPRLFQNNQVGDVVLFQPPTKLQEIVAKSGGRLAKRDLFVKRITAVPGDKVSVDKYGAVQVNGEAPPGRRDLCTAEPLRLIEQYIEPMSYQVEDGNVFLQGDCESVSIDSRVWQELPNENIIGKPLVRLWPLSRFGLVASLPEE